MQLIMLSLLSTYIQIMIYSIALIWVSPYKIKIGDFLLFTICMVIPFYLATNYVYQFISFPVIFIGIYLFMYIHFKNKFVGAFTALLSMLVKMAAEGTVVLSIYLNRFFGYESIDQFLYSSNYIFFGLEVTAGIIAYALAWLVGYILYKKLKISYSATMTTPKILILLLLGVSMCILYLTLALGEHFKIRNEIIIVLSLVLPVYFLIISVITAYLYKLTEKEIVINTQENLIINLGQYADTMETMYNTLREFRHDHINIMSTLSMYLNEKRFDELDVYYHQHLAPYANKIKQDNYKIALLSNLKIMELKGVIAYKAALANENNIDFVVDILEEINSIHMDRIHVCKIIGILLDNAIEESRHCFEPCIHLCIVAKNNSKMLIVANKCRDELPSIENMFREGFSTKGVQRGLGLASLQQITSLYDNCFLETKIVNSQFTVAIKVYD